MWEPIFPPQDRLIPLDTPDKSPLLRASMSSYDKRMLTPKSRAVDGWRSAANNGAVSSERHQLISDILSRWWYVFPVWPPPHFDYKRALRKLHLREVEIRDWQVEPEYKEVDGVKLQKVYQLGNFKGCFRNGQEKFFDMRPKTSCPSFANLQKEPVSKLLTFAIRAYENQIAILKQEKSYNWESVVGECHKKMDLYRKQLQGGGRMQGNLALAEDDKKKVRKV
eukprot:g14391.t1